MATVQSPSDQRMVLYQVSWDTYRAIIGFVDRYGQY